MFESPAGLNFSKALAGVPGIYQPSQALEKLNHLSLATLIHGHSFSLF